MEKSSDRELTRLHKQYMEAAYTSNGYGGSPDFRSADRIMRKIREIEWERIVE